MAEKLRWGILGTGTIANAFATGLASSRRGSLIAVGSRSEAMAQNFAGKYGLKRAHADYASLVADAEVDAIYVATPHSLHREHTLLALEAGKHVLCEKPFALNAAEARSMIDSARSRDLFLMEAMWTRFFPVMEELRKLLQAGAIGEVRLVEADFGFKADEKEEPRLFDPAFGGGSLLDVGVYPVSIASMILGAPAKIESMAQIGATGVDESMAAILGYDGGAMAICKSSIRVDTPAEAMIVGTQGWIRIEPPFWQPSAMTLVCEGKAPQRIVRPFEGNGYHYEADEVARCIRDGQFESAVLPLEESLQIMKTLDRIRERWERA